MRNFVYPVVLIALVLTVIGLEKQINTLERAIAIIDEDVKEDKKDLDAKDMFMLKTLYYRQLIGVSEDGKTLGIVQISGDESLFGSTTNATIKNNIQK